MALIWSLNLFGSNYTLICRYRKYELYLTLHFCIFLAYLHAQNCQSHQPSYSKGGRSLRDESRLTTDGCAVWLQVARLCGDIPTSAEWSGWSVTRGGGGGGHSSHNYEGERRVNIGNRGN